MTIKIYHARRARSARVIWLLEELGVPYQLEVLEFSPAALQAPEYLKLQPLGQIPVVQDGDVTLYESGAIVQYLLEKHGEQRLAPPIATPERPAYLQWFHFGEASLANHLSEIVRQRFGAPPNEHTEAILSLARARFSAALSVVDRALAGREYICADKFTAADIMMIYPIVMARITRELPAQFENVAAYLERLKQRPAYAVAWA